MPQVTLDLPDEEAHALAQFLKRAGYDDYRAKAASVDEAYCMLYAAEKVREALAGVGVAPR